MSKQEGHYYHAKANNQKQCSGPALGIEAQLWAAADKVRGNMLQ
jgi:hypothetical protein